MSLTILILVLAGAAAVAVAVYAWRRIRRRHRQQRLGRAFERARRVSDAGTGEQGKPYSLYGDKSWDQ